MVDPEVAERTIKKMLDDWSGFFWNAFTALAFNGISGDYVEFGSHGGTTFWLAYMRMSETNVPRHLWAFDSFRGLPESDHALDDHPAWQRGLMGTKLADFHQVCAERGIPAEAYTTVEGFYSDTLPRFGPQDAPADIALAYVDCDLYSSSRSVLDFLTPRLKHGMIVAFDDYYCWTSSNVSGERAALHELLTEQPQWDFHRYRDFGWAGTSFVVERADAMAPPPARSHDVDG